jgi:hypothetical protein
VEDFWEESTTFNNIGFLHLKQKQYYSALVCFIRAQRTFTKLGSPNHKTVREYINKLSEEMDRTQFSALQTAINKLDESQLDQIMDKALTEI